MGAGVVVCCARLDLVAGNAVLADEPKTMLDAYSRVMVIRISGMVALRRRLPSAVISASSRRAIIAAEDHVRLTPIGEKDRFDME